MKIKRPLFIAITLLVTVACQNQDASDRADTEPPAAGDASKPPVVAPDITAEFEDPFAYCTALGTIDAPDQRYTGPQSPPAIGAALRQITGDDVGGFTWRCMRGTIYACPTTGETPCRLKPDFNRTGNQAMRAYCRDNPNAFSIPERVAGPATAHEWQCDGTEPFVEETAVTADGAGFRADLWYPIPQPEPSAEPSAETDSEAESETEMEMDSETQSETESETASSSESDSEGNGP